MTDSPITPGRCCPDTPVCSAPTSDSTVNASAIRPTPTAAPTPTTAPPATTAPTPTADTAGGNRWAFLAVLSASLFLVGADNSILFTALPELRAQLHTTDLQALWILNAYPLVLAGLILGTGTLGDRIGHRNMFLIGVSCFGLASLAAALAPNAWVLIATRAALGAGAAMMMPATLALVRTTFTDERERNLAIGIWGSVAVVGAAAGPILGGFLLTHWWWGSVFFINVPVALVVLAATFPFSPPNRPNPSRTWDVVSSLWAMMALAGLVVAIKETARLVSILTGATGSAGHAASSVDTASMPATPAVTGFSILPVALALGISVAGAWLFVRRQRTLREPTLTFDIFRNPVFAGGTLAAGFSMFCVVGTELMTTQRFQLVGGFTPLQAGLLVGAMAVAAFPSSAIGGALLHRLGFIPLVSGGFCLVALGLLGLITSISNISSGSTASIASTTSTASLPLVIVFLVLTGFGTGSVMSVASTAIVGSAPARRAGMAASVEEVSYEFGSLIVVAVLGSLLPLLYSLRAPAAVSGNSDAGVADPVYGAAAAAAYDEAYLIIIAIIAVTAASAALLTAWCFRGNPKGAAPHEAE